jgi:hypothetical protein
VTANEGCPSPSKVAVGSTVSAGSQRREPRRYRGRAAPAQSRDRVPHRFSSYDPRPSPTFVLTSGARSDARDDFWIYRYGRERCAQVGKGLRRTRKPPSLADQQTAGVDVERPLLIVSYFTPRRARRRAAKGSATASRRGA